jgi:hypothetical protein
MMKISGIIAFMVLILISCTDKSDIAVFEPRAIPEPNLELKNSELAPDKKVLLYLSESFKVIPDTIFLSNKTLGIDTCGWKVNFVEGHSFEFAEECIEWGSIVTVEFVNVKKSDVTWLVEQLFYDPEYSWHENHSEYRPEMYYESDWTFKVTKVGNKIILVFSYSWI